MRSAWIKLGLLAGLAVLVAAWALRPAAPKWPGGDRSPAAFSAVNAMADVRAVARAPHPIGSPQQAVARAYLLGRMTALGLNPLERPFAAGGVNLLGVLPSGMANAPALLLMAHYDSVPAGPGAADDGAGVAAVLETVRALKASGGLKRDVMVLLTDGEEAGLVGGKAFFTSDPTHERVGVAINLEARGDRGRAAMFQTQPQSGGLISLLVRAHGLWGASSLMPDLYRRLPNDTDLTWAIRDGHAGLNFAFFAGLDAYHRAGDTPGHLDPASLQSLGNQALAAARILAQAPALPAAAPDPVYADVLGQSILAYPVWGGWVLLGAAAAMLAGGFVRAVRQREATEVGLIFGALAFAGLVLALIVVFLMVGQVRTLTAGHHLAPLLAHDTLAMAGLIAAGAGVGVAWPRLSGSGPRKADLWLGSLLALLLLATTLQALAPLDSFILTWPLLLGALATLLRRGLATCVLAVVGAAQALYWGGLMFELVGQTMPIVLAPFAALALAALAPSIPPPGRRTALAGLGLVGLGVALSLLALAP